MMESLIKEIVAIEGVFSCYLIDREGEIVGYGGKSELDESVVSAIIASVSKELSTQMNIKDDFSITILAVNKNLFIVTKKNFILAVFTDTKIDTGKIKLELLKGVKAISEEL
jgi:predicted regulator of Ras-like GTPase activity (Roadblock/LC7/MglB family)